MRSTQSASPAAAWARFFGAGHGPSQRTPLAARPAQAGAPPAGPRSCAAWAFGPSPGRSPSSLPSPRPTCPRLWTRPSPGPGRFDRQITVDPPDNEGRIEVIKYYLSKVKHSPTINVKQLAAEMVGDTPAKIKHIINEAVIKAHFDGRDFITYEDISYARDVHDWGLKQPIRDMLPEERRRIAYHEAGHTVAQMKLLPHYRVVKATIIRHGRAYGFAAARPVVEQHIRSDKEILAHIQVNLASRAAEELFLGTKLVGVAERPRQRDAAGPALHRHVGHGGHPLLLRCFRRNPARPGASAAGSTSSSTEQLEYVKQVL